MTELRALPDPIDAAIAAAEQPAPVQIAQTTAQLLGNPVRLMQIGLPADATDMEILNAVGVVLAFGDALRAQRTSSRIILPGGRPA